MRRKGVSRAQAMEEMRSRPTLVGAMLVRRGDADAMLCGTRGNYADHLKYVRDVIGLRDGVKTLAAMQMLILPGRQLFICDTHVNRDPDADEIAEMTLLAAEEVQRFGLKPSVALLSHSSFGSSDAPVGAEDARCAGDHPRQGARPRRRRRDARRRGACPRPFATPSSRTRA